MKKIYYINQFFECGWIPYTDLCIIEWIEKSDFEKIIENRKNEWISENDDGVHGEWFYDRIAFDIEKLWWKIECISDENVILDY